MPLKVMSTYNLILVDMFFYCLFQPLTRGEQFFIFIHYALCVLRAKRLHNTYHDIVDWGQAKVGKHSFQRMGAVEGHLIVAGTQRVSERKEGLIMGDTLQTGQIKFIVADHPFQSTVNIAAPTFKLTI